VSVWGTISCYLMLRGFSWKQGICYFSTVVPRHHTSALKGTGFTWNLLRFPLSESTLNFRIFSLQPTGLFVK
ncbi:hypothetical protein, partial [Enterobacter cloacae]|uniref:hypothetical protein n=1 Tax=Enterobacter cloacae TaxID=550 RepID=UPI001E29326D